MKGLTPPEIMQILEVTDGLGLHREAVKIPLMCVAEGSAQIVGTRLQIIAPETTPFDDWLSSLSEQLSGLDLSGLMQAE